MMIRYNANIIQIRYNKYLISVTVVGSQYTMPHFCRIFRLLIIVI